MAVFEPEDGEVGMLTGSAMLVVKMSLPLALCSERNSSHFVKMMAQIPRWSPRELEPPTTAESSLGT